MSVRFVSDLSALKCRKKPFAIAFRNSYTVILNKIIDFSQFQSIVSARFVSDLSALKEEKISSLSHSGINTQPSGKNIPLQSTSIGFGCAGKVCLRSECFKERKKLFAIALQN